MRVLLVAINARWTHSGLALLYLRDAMETAWAQSGQAGGEAVLREYHIGQDRLGIVQDIVAVSPDAVLVSTYIWNAAVVAAILPDIGALLPECRIVLGGPEAAQRASWWLERFPRVDLVVTGAGEGAVRRLALAGFDTGVFGSRIASEPAPDFLDIPSPYRASSPHAADIFHDLGHRYLYYESSRGCPFACSYCLSSRDEHALRMKPADVVMGELDDILAARPMLVKFVDRTFNADPVRARVIWRHLIERARAEGSAGGKAVAPGEGPPRTRFHFEVHPALLRDDDMATLAEAPSGLFQFELGVQTIHQRTRAAVGRTGAWEDERDAIRALAALGTIHLHLDLLAGLPFEGLGELGTGFDEVMALKPDHVQLGFLKGLPGTRLRDEAEAHGMVFQAEPPYEILRSRWLSVADLAELGRVEELVDNTWNTHRYDARLSAAATDAGGWFAFYRSLSAFCAATGFDVRTRNPEKVAAMLDGWEADP